MQQMICVSPHEYRQRDRKIGEAFDVDDNHVEALRLTGKAKLPDEYETRDMTAGPAENYETRDMGTLHAKRKYTRKAV